MQVSYKSFLIPFNIINLTYEIINLIFDFIEHDK